MVFNAWTGKNPGGGYLHNDSEAKKGNTSIRCTLAVTQRRVVQVDRTALQIGFHPPSRLAGSVSESELRDLKSFEIRAEIVWHDLLVLGLVPRALVTNGNEREVVMVCFVDSQGFLLRRLTQQFSVSYISIVFGQGLLLSLWYDGRLAVTAGDELFLVNKI